MCGIIGYVGERLAAPLLAEGLKRLEYRGHDSVGVAIMDAEICTRKAVGRVADLDRSICFVMAVDRSSCEAKVAACRTTSDYEKDAQI